MDDEESRSLAVKSAGAVFMTVASVAVILRCYVRVRLVKGFGWDDGAMLIAGVSFSSSFNVRNQHALRRIDSLHHVLWVHDWRLAVWHWVQIPTSHSTSASDRYEGIFHLPV